MQRDVLEKSLPHGLINSKRRVELGAGLKSRRDYAAVSWENYFDSSEDIEVNDRGTFRVYKSGSSGPLLLLLHGGGFSALTWSLFAAKVTSLSHCQVLALDIRGHGDTTTSYDMDLSNETLTKDIHDLIEVLYPQDPPPIILIGHSMGGAIAIRTAAEGLLPSLIGLVVVDVVEGTALEALSAMQSFLKGRPKMFDSLEKAIEWSVRSGQIRNLESAKVSMQGQLVKCESTSCDDNEPSGVSEHSIATHSDLSVISETETLDSTTEASSDHTGNTNDTKTTDHCKYKWRIDLSMTEQFWKGWFNNMSRLFLSCPVPKLLLVAGRDRLDKELTVAHIQGKFQLQIVQKCGHAVHEDNPDRVAEILVAFMTRYKFTEAKESFQRHMPCC